MQHDASRAAHRYQLFRRGARAGLPCPIVAGKTTKSIKTT